MNDPNSYLNDFVPAGSGPQRNRRHYNTVPGMDRYRFDAALPGLAPRGDRPRLQDTYLPQAYPQYPTPDLPDLSSTHWEEFTTNVGLPNDPYAGQDSMIFDPEELTHHFETEYQSSADSNIVPEGEEPYDTRDNRNRLTRLQWNVLERCSRRTKYIATPPEKWTAIVISQAFERFATPEEMKQLLAEQRGETEPIPYRTYDGNGEWVRNTAVDDPFQDLPSEDDPEGYLLAQHKRDISPHRAALEISHKKATDVRTNSALRPEKQKSCYPCKREKRKCDKKIQPNGICSECVKHQDKFGKKVFNAELNCQLFRHLLPSEPGTWLSGLDDAGNWEARQQVRREEVYRGERRTVNERSKKASKLKKD